MEEQHPQQFHKTVLRQKLAPYALTAMIFGIISIAVMCYFGWVAAIVALVLQKRSMKIYNENPPNFKESSLKMLKAARICGIIGLIASIVTTVFYILYFVLIVGLASHSYNF
ncbi:MAG: hypothetical protein WCQ95_10960 [Bacteroidota bacterium]